MKTGVRRYRSASVKLGYTALVCAHMRGKLREVSHFNTPAEERGNGYGTNLMREICRDADRDRIVLMLLPDTQRLSEWYARFGFVTIQDDPDVMMREPQNG